MPVQTVSFRAPVDKLAALDALATAERRDRTSLLNEAINNYLALQTRRDLETLKALEDADAGLTLPHDKVMAWARSLGTASPLPAPHTIKK
jgi:predicted transcriptional regulator